MAVIMGFKQRGVPQGGRLFGPCRGETACGAWGHSIRRPVRRECPRRGADPHHRRIRLAGPLCRQGRYRTHGGCRAGGDAQRAWTGITTGPRSASGWSEGELPRVGDSVRTKDILLSRAHGRKTDASAWATRSKCSSSRPRGPGATVSRWRESTRTGMDEMDDAVIMTDLRNVQRLADWADGEISGYDDFHLGLAPEPTISHAGSDGPCSTTMPTTRRTSP